MNQEQVKIDQAVRSSVRNSKRKLDKKMAKTNLKEIEKLAEKFSYDELEVKKELKRIQSVKCRLKKQKFKTTYEKEMLEVIAYEQALKEAKQLINPTEKFVTDYDQKDVDQLDYDQTVRALRSIQSKICNSQFKTENIEDNEEYQKAKKIEQMLKEHRKLTKPTDTDVYVRKTEIQTIIDTIENSGKLSQDQLLELLNKINN